MNEEIIQIGDIVYDTLTRKKVKVLDYIKQPNPTSFDFGYLVESDYLDGYRFAWEVTKIEY